VQTLVNSFSTKRGRLNVAMSRARSQMLLFAQRRRLLHGGFPLAKQFATVFGDRDLVHWVPVGEMMHSLEAPLSSSTQGVLGRLDEPGHRVFQGAMHLVDPPTAPQRSSASPPNVAEPVRFGRSKPSSP